MSIKKNFFAPLASGLGATRRAAMLLLVMMLTTVTTWADNYETLTSTTKTWENNTYVTNGNVTIANRITVKGNVTLILTDGYILTASKGIEVSEGNSLTIEGGTNGTGKLIIEGCAEGKSGIGGGSGTPAKYGNITINGGIVNVTGGKKGAGIGGNNNSSITGNGTITINGGIVNATGGTGAAGIGGVIYGDITINGGRVNVKGGVNGAGIGGNNNSSINDNGKITIIGGVVNATGGTGAAGIGGGCGSNKNGAYGGCGAIVINGGQVTATGGGDGPGIGPGKDGDDNSSGSLVLGWTNTTDFIKVTGVKSNLNVVYGFSDRLKSINFAVDKKFNISGGGEATIKDITNLESVELIPKGSEQHQLSVATISGISASYDLTGSSLDIPFSVSDAEEKTLTLGTDYTATLGTIALNSASIHITEGGKYTLTINGMGSYAGSKSVDFEVVSIGFKKDANGDDYINMPKTGIENATIPEGVSSFKVYDDGGAKAKYSNSYDGGLVLTAPDHYVLQLTGTVTAEVSGNTLYDYLMVYDGGSTSAQKIGDKYGSDESGENIGELISSGKQMTLTFHSDVSGQRDGLDLTVTLKRDLGSCVIANIDDQPYTGSAIKPDLVITYEGTALVKDVDYDVAYSANTIVGTATITITGKENYAGTTSKTFNIVKATPNVSAPAAVDNLIYSGKNQALVVAGTTNFGTLLYRTDGNNYSEDIPTATDAGTYTVYYKVAGDANHNDVSGSIEVTITQKAVTNDGITVTIPSQVWTGSELTPVITVKDGETELIKNTDYTVTAPSGPVQDSGNHAYTITGKGNYSDSKEATFTISPRLARQAGAVYVYEDQNGKTALLEGTSVDQVDIPSNLNITVNHVTSNRVFTPGKASTVMLPFDYTCIDEEGGTFYKFVGVEKENDNWVATMKATGDDANNQGTLIANTPYLFMPTATGMSFPNINGSVTLSTEGGGNCETADEGSHWTFKGTYEYKEWQSGGANAAEIGKVYGFAGVAKDDINVGDFVKVANGAKIRPMCCYLLWNNEPNSANARSFTRGAAATDEELPQRITVRLVGSNGETTAIGTLDTKTGEIDFSGWYDMSGHKLSGKPTKKGLYINNGKKVVIK